MTNEEVIEAIKRNPHSREFNGNIQELPTIQVGHFDNLKVEWSDSKSFYRIWVSRLTVADGVSVDNQIILEHKYKDSYEGCHIGTSLGDFPKGTWRQFPLSR